MQIQINPKVSILMPVWNRGHLVRNAIQSILDQTYPDFELICVDDGSTDNTLQILKTIQKLDNRIKVYHQKHSGLVPALEIGHELCSGQIIVKQDSDDASLPNRIERIISYFNQHPDTDFFYHGMYQIWEDSENMAIHRSYIPALPIDQKRLLQEQYIPGCFAYTKKFIKEIPYRQLICSEDWMIILDAVLKNKKIGFLDEGLYECMLREDSNSLINEGTGAYEKDEAEMRKVLKEEYNIKEFHYAKR